MLTLGVDAHKGVHEAVALDDAGRECGRRRVPNRAAGIVTLTVLRQAAGARRRVCLRLPAAMGRRAP